MDLVGVAFGEGSCGAFGVGFCYAILLLGDREGLGQVAVRDGLPCGGKLLDELGDGLGRAVEVDIGAECLLMGLAATFVHRFETGLGLTLDIASIVGLGDGIVLKFLGLRRGKGGLLPTLIGQGFEFLDGVFALLSLHLFLPRGEFRLEDLAFCHSGLGLLEAGHAELPQEGDDCLVSLVRVACQVHDLGGGGDSQSPRIAHLHDELTVDAALARLADRQIKCGAVDP